LSGTDLRWTDLREANLEGADFTNARANIHTVWPDGFDPETHGVEIRN
jgi:uncharacterized protein YjbI with pentapeptide repeats